MLLNIEELQKFKERAVYKKSNRIIYNLKHVVGCWKKVNEVGDVKFSFNGNYYSSSAVFSLRAIIYLLKPFVISYEIIDIKKRIIDKTLNGTLRNFEISDLMKQKTHYWMEFKIEKIKILKDVVIECLEDSKIEQCIFEVCEHLESDEKEERYNILINSLKEKFEDAISECKKANYGKSVIDFLGYEAAADVIINNYNGGILTTKSTD